jgi:hypothetical protein
VWSSEKSPEEFVVDETNVAAREPPGIPVDIIGRLARENEPLDRGLGHDFPFACAILRSA